MDDLLRHLHDFLYVLDGDGVFLPGHIEADQLQFVTDDLLVTFACCAHSARHGRAACNGGDFRKLLRDQLGKIQHHDHGVPADILDDAGQ